MLFLSARWSEPRHSHMGIPKLHLPSSAQPTVLSPPGLQTLSCHIACQPDGRPATKLLTLLQGQGPLSQAGFLCSKGWGPPSHFGPCRGKGVFCHQIPTGKPPSSLPHSTSPSCPFGSHCLIATGIVAAPDSRMATMSCRSRCHRHAHR